MSESKCSDRPSLPGIAEAPDAPLQCGHCLAMEFRWRTADDGDSIGECAACGHFEIVDRPELDSGIDDTEECCVRCGNPNDNLSPLGICEWCNDFDDWEDDP